MVKKVVFLPPITKYFISVQKLLSFFLSFFLSIILSFFFLSFFLFFFRFFLSFVSSFFSSFIRFVSFISSSALYNFSFTLTPQSSFLFFFFFFFFFHFTFCCSHTFKKTNTLYSPFFFLLVHFSCCPSSQLFGFFIHFTHRCISPHHFRVPFGFLLYFLSHHFLPL
ncbi:unnamed protein product [Acanthosepion pharaonis]|uniref:Uncharacterized protein n=1 Tax=Acanthosepion pharaonis TaxID=158019 RepID=A0A812CQG4_ACAPH|nr:unnamed protein product [Sepia pharaonis]